MPAFAYPHLQKPARMSLRDALAVAHDPLGHDAATVNAARDALAWEIAVREKHDETVPRHIEMALRALEDFDAPYPGHRTFTSYGGAA